MTSKLNIDLEQGLAAIEKLGQEALNEPKIYVSTILEVRVLFTIFVILTWPQVPGPLEPTLALRSTESTTLLF